MKLQRGEVLALVLVVVALLMSVVFYGRLPEQVPSHWNIRGEVDGYSSRPVGAFFMPAVMAGLWLLFLALPAISPRGFRFESFRAVWGILQSTILGLLLLVHALMLSAAMGKPVDVTRGAEAGVGLLIAVLGNFLGKVSRNFFVGIRTPWTLASEEVWLRTHRLGGKLFVLAGLAMFVLTLAGAGPITTTVPLFAAALASVAASYFIYRNVEGFKEEIPEDHSTR
jgi:immunity protein, SdpI family